MKIMLVEDDPAIGAMLTMALELEEHTVALWTCGAAFIFFLAQEETTPAPFDLLITDWSLPRGISGGEVIESLRLRYGARLPAIIITGTSEEQVSLIGACYPQVPVLRKPFPLQHLLWSMQQVLLHSHGDVY